MKSTATIALLAVYATSSYAWGGYYNSGDDSTSSTSSEPYSSGNSGDSSSDFNDSGFSFGFGYSSSSYHKKLIAHAVLATVAFGFMFPAGGILIRLGNFRGLWLAHGLWQLLSYSVYIVAFGLGVFLVRSSPRGTIVDPHPIIGIILLGLIFFQPFFGLMHHLLFKKHLRRTFWSYAHLWLGRIIVTLGIINGGLGLRLARKLPIVGPPGRGAIIGYSAAAGVMWLLYVLAVVLGERRRSRVRQTAAQATGNEKAYASSKSSSYNLEERARYA